MNVVTTQIHRCATCGKDIAPDDGGTIWYHTESMSNWCDGNDDADHYASDGTAWPIEEAMDSSDFPVGTCVQTDTYGYRGVVSRTYEGCPVDEYWIAAQTVAIRPEALAVDYPWFRVLAHGGGAVVIPLYDLTAVEHFTVDNPYVSQYMTERNGRYLPL